MGDISKHNQSLEIITGLKVKAESNYYTAQQSRASSYSKGYRKASLTGTTSSLQAPAHLRVAVQSV